MTGVRKQKKKKKKKKKNKIKVLNMVIHVLTLSWNGLDKLKILRPGLMRNLEKTGQKFKWYIRDNGSKDGTVEEVSKWENTVVYDIGHNRDNFAQGMNYLFEQSNANDDDLILSLNNDIDFGIYNSSLLNMLNVIKKDPQISVVGARLLYEYGHNLQHAGVIFGTKYNLMPYHFRHKESIPSIDKQHRLDPEATTNRYFQAVTAAVCFIKAEDFKKVAGFNPKYFWAFEDIDFCLKISHICRKKIAYCGETYIIHKESATLKKNPVNKMFLVHNIAEFHSNWWVRGVPKYDCDHKQKLNENEKYLNEPDSSKIDK